MDLPTILDIEPITLPDGTTLSEQQSHAAFLHATTDLTHDEIAEQTTYQSRQGVSSFLRSRNGQLAVRAALISHLQDAGRTGLRATIDLASSARSETVRQLAAAKLVEWSGLAGELQQSQGHGGGGPQREISININVGGEQHAATIDITPQEEQDDA